VVTRLLLLKQLRISEAKETHTQTRSCRNFFIRKITCIFIWVFESLVRSYDRFTELVIDETDFPRNFEACVLRQYVVQTCILLPVDSVKVSGKMNSPYQDISVRTQALHFEILAWMCAVWTSSMLMRRSSFSLNFQCSPLIIQYTFRQNFSSKFTLSVFLGIMLLRWQLH
jgi:hypothetical protein